MDQNDSAPPAAEPVAPPTVPEEVNIDLAMKHANGNKTLAAKALGISRDAFVARLKKFPALSMKWIKPRDPNGCKTNVLAVEEASGLNVPDKYQSISAENKLQGKAIQKVVLSEEEIAAQIEAQKLKTREDLAATGLDDDGINATMAVHQFYLNHSQHAMSMLGGGMMFASSELLSLIKHLKDHPYDDEVTPDGGQIVKQGRRATHDMILRAISEHRNSALGFANLELLKRKIQAVSGGASGGAGKKKAKTAFSPMRANVLAQPGSTVVLNSHGPEPEKTPEA